MHLISTLSPATIGIIGGADGPTSIFIAGKIGNGTLFFLAAVVVLLAAGLFWYLKKRK